MLGAELRAQTADVHVDGAGAAEEVVAPDLLQQLGAGEDPARVLGEVLEQLELLVGELEQPPAQPRRVRGLVDHELAEDERAVVAARVGAGARLEQPQPGVHLGRPRAGQQDLVDHPLPGHRDEPALGEHRDDRHVHAGAAEQPAEAAGRDQIRARVDEHGVVRARIEQRGHLGGGRADTVREERQCG